MNLRKHHGKDKVMKLKEWKKINRWTTTAMAKELGITFGTLSGIERGVYKSSLLLKKAIVKFTNNEVTLEDLGGEEI